MKSFKGRAKFVTFATIAIVAFGGAPAEAASNHAISGTVYSPCSGSGPWFTSATQRTKAGTGPIRAQFNTVNTGGLTFRLLSPTGVQIGNTQSWASTETGIWRTFASNVANGRKFHNSFRQTSTACGQSNYNFAGTEFY